MSSKKINVKVYVLALIGVVFVLFLLKECVIGGDKGNKFIMKIPGNENSIANIKNVNLYIDFSGSMRGFVDGANPQTKDFNEFTASMVSTVSQGLTNFAGDYDVSPVSFCGGKPYNNVQFQKAMEDHSIWNESTTILHDLIMNSIENVTDSSVNILVSDMVMSYGKKKLLKENNAHYNRDQLEVLSSKVYDVFFRLKKRNIQTILLQYQSDYNGKWYCNYTENIVPNVYKDKLMKNRPFYVLICSSESNLRKIMEDKCFTGYQKVYSTFNLPQSQSQVFSINSDKPNVWIVGNDSTKVGTIWSDVASDGDEAHLTLICKAFPIPNYINVKKEPEFDNASISQVICPEYVNESGEYNFYVTLKPYGKWKKDMHSYISIVTDNTWFKSSSAKDDTIDDASKLEGRTWGFESFIGALNKAYFGSPDIRPKEEVARFEFVVSK